MIDKLIEDKNLGESLSVSCDMDEDIVEIYLDSIDISTSCGFSYEEWENFVSAVNEANDKFLSLKK